ncbi:MAG: helix-turn-helix domain-containing protein [Verrucomicrobiia bacterium]
MNTSEFSHTKIDSSTRDSTVPTRETGAGRLLTRRQVADLLRLCPHTVGRLTKEGKLPALFFNRRTVRYRLTDIEDFISQAKVSTNIGGSNECA